MISGQRILVVGAHPDDIEIGMGGTLELLTRNNRVFCYHTTSGVYSDKNGCPVRNFEDILAETKESLAMFGIADEDIFFTNIPATELKHDKTSISSMQNIIETLEITCVFTHSATGTWHQDHIATHLITQSACRRFVNNIYAYECVFDAGKGIMLPNIYVPISIDNKINCLSKHKTEYNKFGEQEWTEKIKNMARYRGDQVGVKFAECFEVIKEVWKYW